MADWEELEKPGIKELPSLSAMTRPAAMAGRAAMAANPEARGRNQAKAEEGDQGRPQGWGEQCPPPAP